MRYWVTLVCLTVLASLALAAAPSPVRAENDLCFTVTSFCISGGFRDYWETHGGLAVFGYPISGVHQETNRDSGYPFATQWFERARFEWHPENVAPYHVLLGRLGDDALLLDDRRWQDLPAATGAQVGCLWFAETRHNVCDQAAGHGFKRYWEQHGLEFDGQPGTSFAESLALFGRPLTEPMIETNSSGDRVLTQWFERARFEWHPNNPDEFTVLLGLIGGEVQLPFDRIMNPELHGMMTIAGLHDFVAGTRTQYELNADGSRMQRFYVDPNHYSEVVSPDGNKAVVQMLHNGVSGLYVINKRDHAIISRITSDPTAYPFDWSPDGRRILFRSGLEGRRGLYVIQQDGTNEVRLHEGAPGRMPGWADWSPTSEQIVYNAETDGSFLINADGSGRRPFPADFHHVQWVPDGRRLLYVSSADAERLYSYTPTGGDPQVIASGMNIYAPWRVSPDGRQVAFFRTESPGSVYTVEVDGGQPVALFTPGPGGGVAFNGLAWSPDSTQLAVLSWCGDVCAVPTMRVQLAQRDGTGRREIFSTAHPALATGTNRISGMAWAPGGDFLGLSVAACKDRWDSGSDCVNAAIIGVARDGRRILPVVHAKGTEELVIRSWTN